MSNVNKKQKLSKPKVQFVNKSPIFSKKILQSLNQSSNHSFIQIQNPNSKNSSLNLKMPIGNKLNTNSNVVQNSNKSNNNLCNQILLTNNNSLSNLSSNISNKPLNSKISINNINVNTNNLNLNTSGINLSILNRINTVANSPKKNLNKKIITNLRTQYNDLAKNQKKIHYTKPLKSSNLDLTKSHKIFSPLNNTNINIINDILKQESLKKQINKINKLSILNSLSKSKSKNKSKSSNKRNQNQSGVFDKCEFNECENSNNDLENSLNQMKNISKDQSTSIQSKSKSDQEKYEILYIDLYGKFKKKCNECKKLRLDNFNLYKIVNILKNIINYQKINLENQAYDSLLKSHKLFNKEISKDKLYIDTLIKENNKLKKIILDMNHLILKNKVIDLKEDKIINKCLSQLLCENEYLRKINLNLCSEYSSNSSINEKLNLEDENKFNKINLFENSLLENNSLIDDSKTSITDLVNIQLNDSIKEDQNRKKSVIKNNNKGHKHSNSHSGSSTTLFLDRLNKLKENKNLNIEYKIKSDLLNNSLIQDNITKNYQSHTKIMTKVKSPIDKTKGKKCNSNLNRKSIKLCYLKKKNS